jgi:hypothetical protein
MTIAILTGDFHCGSETGLDPNPDNPIQEKVLECYLDAIRRVGSQPDLLFLNGDLIDGEQKRGRSKGDKGDLELQIDKAVALVKMWEPKRIIITTGTQYHVGGDSIEAESMIADLLKEGGSKVEVHRKANVTINNWFRMELRHHLGSSGVPHGRHTAGARSRLWNVLNAAHNGTEWPPLNVYNHVHYWHYEEDAWSASMGVPAWQAIGNRYDFSYASYCCWNNLAKPKNCYRIISQFSRFLLDNCQLFLDGK